jgi:hypothetical protein
MSNPNDAAHDVLLGFPKLWGTKSKHYVCWFFESGTTVTGKPAEVSSDYDLIFIMLGTLMFFSMRTASFRGCPTAVVDWKTHREVRTFPWMRGSLMLNIT